MLEGTNSFWYNGRYLKEKRSDMTQIIDGKALAAKLQGQLAEKTTKLKEETGSRYHYPSGLIRLDCQIQSRSSLAWDFGSVTITKTYR